MISANNRLTISQKLVMLITKIRMDTGRFFDFGEPQNTHQVHWSLTQKREATKNKENYKFLQSPHLCT